MENQKSSSRQKALSLIDLSSAFVLYGVGVGLAVLVFLVELLFNRIRQHRDELIKIEQEKAAASAAGAEELARFDPKYFW